MLCNLEGSQSIAAVDFILFFGGGSGKNTNFLVEIKNPPFVILHVKQWVLPFLK